jgi:hypothetical protein
MTTGSCHYKKLSCVNKEVMLRERNVPVDWFFI